MKNEKNYEKNEKKETNVYLTISAYYKYFWEILLLNFIQNVKKS
jgi:hypothetical protein